MTRKIISLKEGLVAVLYAYALSIAREQNWDKTFAKQKRLYFRLGYYGDDSNT